MADIKTKDDESFRDRIATADQKGKRIWLHPAKPKGNLTRARSIVAFFLLLFLFTAPFFKLSGQPLILLDILDRTFIIFGLIFRPADFHLFVLALLAAIVFAVLFTAIFGRLFCGWICPQTVFMEMVFRKIEYWIDGSPARQRQLMNRSWDAVKIYKRFVKHGIFFVISFIIGNTLLAYIIGADRLLLLITAPPIEHLAGLIAMIIFSLLFYFVFSWFREQACTLVCPYGRLQGVLIDPHSIIVAYDSGRGEPRDRFKKGEKRLENGDCINCRACVSVCPTGIDIRNGTQLECINCTACIDACNRVMDKVGFDRGLIRYSSEEKIKGNRYKIPGRMYLYSVAFLILTTLLTALMVTRTDFETTIMRAAGSMYYETESGSIRNLFSVKMINKTFDTIPVSFRLREPIDGKLTLVGNDFILEPEGIGETAFFIDIEKDQLFGPSRLIVIEVYGNGRLIEEISSSFLAPRKGESQ